jgi:hypothetical protein
MNISKTNLVKKLIDNKGQFLSVTFIKKNGDARKLNGKIPTENYMDLLGYLRFTTNKGEEKRVDCRKLISATIDHEEFVVK